jgi:hypothetical protein
LWTKGGFFPLGAIRSEQLEYEGNLWRESSFALHLLKQAVNPRLTLVQCIRHWQDIALQLAEPHRHRRRQLHALALS